MLGNKRRTKIKRGGGQNCPPPLSLKKLHLINAKSFELYNQIYVRGQKIASLYFANNGSFTMNALPSPSLLSTRTSPPESVTMRLTIESPSPLPRVACELSPW